MVKYDTALFWWINSHHNTFMDWLMWGASQHWSSAAVIVAAYVGCLVLMKRRSVTLPYGWLLIAAGIALCFLFSDQISVHCFKNVFHRLRPCHAFEGVRMFHTRCGGQYGFVSSHAANSFAAALFIGLSWRKAMKGKASAWPLVLLLLWAAVVCYSRVYLGKHFPADVVAGGCVGLIVGGAVYWMMASIARRVSRKPEQ